MQIFTDGCRMYVLRSFDNDCWYPDTPSGGMKSVRVPQPWNATERVESRYGGSRSAWQRARGQSDPRDYRWTGSRRVGIETRDGPQRNRYCDILFTLDSW